MAGGGLIEIRLTGCRIFLSDQELISLLVRDPELWALSIKRGKGILRARQARERQAERDREYFR